MARCWWRALGAREVVVGEDFHFGHGRKGNVALLRRWAPTPASPSRGSGCVRRGTAGRVEPSRRPGSASWWRRATWRGPPSLLGRPHQLRGWWPAATGGAGRSWGSRPPTSRSRRDLPAGPRHLRRVVRASGRDAVADGHLGGPTAHLLRPMASCWSRPICWTSPATSTGRRPGCRSSPGCGTRGLRLGGRPRRPDAPGRGRGAGAAARDLTGLRGRGRPARNSTPEKLGASSRFRTLPAGLRGSGSARNQNRVGTLKAASRSATNRANSSASTSCAGTEDDHGTDLLAQHLVGHADDGTVGHGRVFDQGRLDLHAVDVLPTPDDHVLGPVDDVDESLLVDAGHVAGVEPSPGEVAAVSSGRFQ